MASKVYSIRKGKRTRVARGVPFSPKRYANVLRSTDGRGNYRAATAAEVRRWKPSRKKRRTSTGGRRRLTFVQQIFKILRVDTGRRRRRSGRY